MSSAHSEKQPTKPATGPEKPSELKGSTEVKQWDRVDEASWESFPASDPPGRWAGKDKDEAPPTLNGEAREEPPKE